MKTTLAWLFGYAPPPPHPLENVVVEEEVVAKPEKKNKKKRVRFTSLTETPQRRRRSKRGRNSTSIPGDRLEQMLEWISDTPTAIFRPTPDHMDIELSTMSISFAIKTSVFGSGAHLSEFLKTSNFKGTLVDLASQHAHAYWSLAYICDGSLERMEAYLETQ